MNTIMELQEARTILSEMNRWRRAQGEYDVAGAPMPFSPVAFGEAIDKAIDVIDKELSDERYE